MVPVTWPYAWLPLRRDHREQAPLVGNALEAVEATVLEFDPRTATRSLTVEETSTSRGPAAEETREPMWTAVPPMSSESISISPVCSTSPHLDAQGSDRLADRDGRSDGPGRPVEHRQESVTCDGTSRPRNRSNSRRTTVLCDWMTSRHRRSPRRAASCVEPTMSVNSTVARTRSGSGAGRTPVTNSWISLTIASASPAQIKLSSPGSSTNRAFGMCAARYRPCPTASRIASPEGSRRHLDRSLPPETTRP